MSDYQEIFDRIKAAKEKIHEEIGSISFDIQRIADEISDLNNQVNDLLDKVYQNERTESEKCFAEWLAHGINVGAKFKVNNEHWNGKVFEVCGISSTGFVVKPAGEERTYTLNHRCLDKIDEFEVIAGENSEKAQQNEQ